MNRKQLKEIKPEIQDIPRKKWNTSWRRLIWKIYDADPLQCTTYGIKTDGERQVMKIIKVYTAFQAERELKKLTAWKYYIKGRWRINKRMDCLGPLEGFERRQVA